MRWFLIHQHSRISENIKIQTVLREENLSKSVLLEELVEQGKPYKRAKKVQANQTLREIQ
jgi:hypothetical protein